MFANIGGALALLLFQWIAGSFLVWHIRTSGFGGSVRGLGEHGELWDHILTRYGACLTGTCMGVFCLEGSHT